MSRYGSLHESLVVRGERQGHPAGSASPLLDRGPRGPVGVSRTDMYARPAGDAVPVGGDLGPAVVAIGGMHRGATATAAGRTPRPRPPSGRSAASCPARRNSSFDTRQEPDGVVRSRPRRHRLLPGRDSQSPLLSASAPETKKERFLLPWQSSMNARALRTAVPYGRPRSCPSLGAGESRTGCSPQRSIELEAWLNCTCAGRCTGHTAFPPAGSRQSASRIRRMERSDATPAEAHTP